MEDLQIVKLHIVPWALPKEDIPIHVQWEPEFDFQTVTIEISEGLVFVDFANLDEVRIEGHRATIEKPNISRGTSTYFGCIIRCVQIPKEIRFQGKVVVSFADHAGTRLSRELEARIFRPQLSIVDAPKLIELTDSSRVRSLPLYLKYTGFGDIQLRVEATIGGTIVSEGGSVALETVRRLWLYEISEKEENMETAKKKETLRIAPEYVKTIAKEVQQILDTGKVPADVFDKETFEEIKKWLQDVRMKNRFMELFYSRIEDMLSGLLVDLLESHPATNVRLVDPKARILTRIRAPIENLRLRLSYRDLVGNEYEPVEAPIKIVDRRTGEKSVLEIPIAVEKWDDKPLLNVAGI